MEDQNIWLDFNVDTERVYSGEGGTKIRVTVPDRVIALRYMAPTDEEMEKNDPFGTRMKLATQYSGEGDVIDTNIDVWGWGAANTYSQRRGYGYETVPDCMNHYRIYTPPDPIPTSKP